MRLVGKHFSRTLSFKTSLAYQPLVTSKQTENAFKTVIYIMAANILGLNAIRKWTDALIATHIK